MKVCMIVINEQLSMCRIYTGVPEGTQVPAGTYRVITRDFNIVYKCRYN